MTSTNTDNQQGASQSVPIYNAGSSHEHSHACNDPSHHHHHYPPLFDQDDDYSSMLAAKNEMLMKKKAKKNASNAGVTRAELIPGHRGDGNIDDLVNFINGTAPANKTTANKKSKKKNSTDN